MRSHRQFLEEAFPSGHNEPYLTWGGYNLNRILTHMNWLHDPSCRFNFSSIASLFGSSKEPLPAVRHRNRYRQMMLERERTQCFWDVLQETQPRYLFMDLMEERFDLVSAGGRYLTKSDAYDGRLEGETEGPVIPRSSPACTELWEKSARAFVDEIRKRAPKLRPVIVESYLCETVGDLEHRTPFANLDGIRQTNAILASYYRYLEVLWPEAVVVRLADDPLFFTDSKYEYGAIPSHLNELINQQTAERIEQLLKNEDARDIP